jgi:hypothetical protein
MTGEDVQIIYSLYPAGLEVKHSRYIAISSQARQSALSKGEQHDRRKNHAEIPNFD